MSSILDRNSAKFTNTDISCKRIWDQFESDANLIDCFRVTNKNRRLYTYSSSTHSKSRIDRIYTTLNLSGKVLSTSFVNNEFSDHKIIITKFAKSIKREKGVYVFNNSILEDQVFDEKVKETFNDFENSLC